MEIANDPRPEAPVQEAVPQERPVFENVCTGSYEVYLQCYRATKRHSFSWWAGWLALALYVAGVLGFCIAWNDFNPFTLGIMAVCVGLYLYWLLGTPHRLARLSARQDEENYHQPAQVRLSFFQDHYVIHNIISGGALEQSYQAIQYCAETRDCLVLATQGKQFVPLAKAGFQGAEIEAVRRFLMEKAPQAKFYWKKR